MPSLLVRRAIRQLLVVGMQSGLAGGWHSRPFETVTLRSNSGPRDMAQFLDLVTCQQLRLPKHHRKRGRRDRPVLQLHLSVL